MEQEPIQLGNGETDEEVNGIAAENSLDAENTADDAAAPPVTSEAQPEETQENTQEKAKPKIGRKKLILLIAIGLVAAIAAILIFEINVNNKSKRYNEGTEYLEQEKYAEAVDCFLALGSFRDSKKMAAYAKIKRDYLSVYSEVPAEENRIGIWIKGGHGGTSIDISFNNKEINQSADNCEILTSRCSLFDAEHPEVKIETNQYSVEKTTNNTYSGTSTHAFGGGLSFSEDNKCNYMLLKFDGVPRSEMYSLETPALFWIVSLEEDGSVTVLTETPLLDQ